MTLKEKRKKYLEEELKNREMDIKFFIASICEEIKNKKESIKSLEEVLNTLGAGNVDKEMKIVTKILSTYPNKIESLKSEIVRLDEKINNDSHNIKYIENIVYFINTQNVQTSTGRRDIPSLPTGKTEGNIYYNDGTPVRTTRPFLRVRRQSST